LKITVLNGNRKEDYFDDYLHEMSAALGREGHDISSIELRAVSMLKCKGCFGCWVKTPGKCVSNDASCDISREVMRSDAVIFASPIIMGFVSPLLKNANDKLIQNLLPYVDIVQGEIHHAGRYRRYPSFGLLLGVGEDADEEDVDIIRQIYGRIALNFRTSLRFVLTTTKPVEEAIHEIGNI
jgi:multimeric flavodoxin WrbA